MLTKGLADKVVNRIGQASQKGLIGSLPFSRLMVANGVVSSRQIEMLDTIGSLADVEFSVFSQWGEDGIIEWLVQKNGPMPETFVEFGVEDYQEANTRYLLCSRNWRGLVIDGSEENIAAVRSDNISWRHDLSSTAAFITRSNINSLIGEAGFGGELGILSVDIDGNDYWVWQAIDCVRPQFVIAEYNSVFGDIHALTVPYDDAFVRTQAHHSNLYYGASILALGVLAEARGYTLLGSNRAGSNAFFVRNDRLHRFQDRIGDRTPRPSRFREGRGPSRALTFARGQDRARVIGDCRVVDVVSGKDIALKQLGELYSDRWKALLEGAAF